MTSHRPTTRPLREGKGRIYEGGQRVPLMVRWPGHIEAGSVSDSIVGSIDLYPTILDAVGLEKPKGHIVDGESITPVLKQAGKLKRQAYFTWFPHLVPAVSVRKGDWKLIRRFEPHPKYPEIQELYNLKEDIGETRNLAGQSPTKVKELDALIDQFVRDTGALVPKPNSNFDANAETKRRVPNPAVSTPTESVAGLVPRNCRIVSTEGAIRVVGNGRRSFLGTAQVRFSGPLTLKLRARSHAGGKGQVRWRTAGQDSFLESSQIATYNLPAGMLWQDVSVSLPVQGKPTVIRLYLPFGKTAVEVQSIQFMDQNGRDDSWDFSGVTP